MVVLGHPPEVREVRDEEQLQLQQLLARALASLHIQSGVDPRSRTVASGSQLDAARALAHATPLLLGGARHVITSAMVVLGHPPEVRDEEQLQLQQLLARALASLYIQSGVDRRSRTVASGQLRDAARALAHATPLTISGARKAVDKAIKKF
jgi:uncharacterized protein YciI